MTACKVRAYIGGLVSLTRSLCSRSPVDVLAKRVRKARVLDFQAPFENPAHYSFHTEKCQMHVKVVGKSEAVLNTE